ncbi:MAG: hypothetical protein HOP12_11450 [Candidatus Eisenbacteria bacterium]|uniref:FlgD Ig-like domain-containing protein n=1 Tax=Eiseniibacteriota bacterium TaxID=2212470 RepID=A0A849SJZ6_UNCEI|nr:hypothetical protein [Candidatus Eisenbacteria bacterium]
MPPLARRPAGPARWQLTLTLAALLAVMLAPLPAAADWSADSTIGTPVCLASGDLLDPLMVSDGAGGFIVMWTDFRKPGFDPDIYCTRVNASGDTLWGSGGLVVCDAPGLQLRSTIIADGQGGAFMAWMDLRTSGGSQGYYVQHIAANGVRRWAANGTRPVSGLNSQFGPKICRDTTGGIFLAFASGSPGTQLQRLDSLGVKRLGSFPPAEGPLLRSNPSAPLAITADGFGGAIVALGYGGSTPVDIAAQRATTTGALLWAASGVTVCAATGSQGGVELVADGLGGATLAWDDGRASGGDIYAQRISAAGSAMWAADGVAVCNVGSIESGVQLRTLGDGAAIAVWRDYRHLPATSLYAQRIAGDGSFDWASNGLPVSSGTPAIEGFSVVPGEADDTIVSWNTTSSSGGDVFAQKIDGAGARQWGDYAATVCRGPLDQTESAAVADGAGGVLVSFRDARVSGNPNLYAQHLGPDGSLGSSPVAVPWIEPVSRAWLRVAPNPSRGPQELRFDRPLAAAAHIEVLDVLGRRRGSRTVAAGALSWRWDGRDDLGARVASGVYLVRVATAGHVAIARVVRLD